VGRAEEASGVCLAAHVRIVGGEEDVFVGMVMCGNVPPQADLGLKERARHVRAVNNGVRVERDLESYWGVAHSMVDHFGVDRSIEGSREAGKTCQSSAHRISGLTYSMAKALMSLRTAPEMGFAGTVGSADVNVEGNTTSR